MTECDRLEQDTHSTLSLCLPPFSHSLTNNMILMIPVCGPGDGIQMLGHKDKQGGKCEVKCYQGKESEEEEAELVHPLITSMGEGES